VREQTSIVDRRDPGRELEAQFRRLVEEQHRQRLAFLGAVREALEQVEKSR
jgi:hypothetical protein